MADDEKDPEETTAQGDGDGGESRGTPTEEADGQDEGEASGE